VSGPRECGVQIGALGVGNLSEENMRGFFNEIVKRVHITSDRVPVKPMLQRAGGVRVFAKNPVQGENNNVGFVRWELDPAQENAGPTHRNIALHMLLNAILVPWSRRLRELGVPKPYIAAGQVYLKSGGFVLQGLIQDHSKTSAQLLARLNDHFVEFGELLKTDKKLMNPMVLSKIKKSKRYELLPSPSSIDQEANSFLHSLGTEEYEDGEPCWHKALIILKEVESITEKEIIDFYFRLLNEGEYNSIAMDGGDRGNVHLHPVADFEALLAKGFSRRDTFPWGYIDRELSDESNWWLKCQKTVYQCPKFEDVLLKKAKQAPAPAPPAHVLLGLSPAQTHSVNASTRDEVLI